MPKNSFSFFTKQLMLWFKSNHRPMPWKGVKDPYLIWLSEIILQQTRVEQGWAYYEKFRDNYPSVKDLAKASEDEVLKLWEGLGYYSRARNLHFTAKYITDELGGIFPKEYKNILALKGVGPYTAAAIGSFAYDLPVAVVDGNVYRVLARFLGIKTPIDSTAGKKAFNECAQTLLDKKRPADYNQAIMDFGAVQCVPKNPNCVICPLHKKCIAFQNNTVAAFPIKEKKIKKRKRFFHYLIFSFGDQILINKRIAKDIWQNLYEFPMIEAEQILEQADLFELDEVQSFIEKQAYTVTLQSKPFKQTLTHQNIVAVFYEITLNKAPFYTAASYRFIKRENLSNFAFPKIIDLYLQDKVLYLNLSTS